MRAIIKNNEIVGIGNSVEGVEIPLDLIFCRTFENG